MTTVKVETAEATGIGPLRIMPLTVATGLQAHRERQELERAAAGDR